MSFLEYAPAPESRAILHLRDAYGLFIDGEFVDGHGTPFATISPADEKHIATIAARERGGRRRRRRRRPPRLRQDLVEDERRATAASTCSASPGSCRSAPASSPWPRASTTASRSRRAATSTSRSSPPGSSTTPAGPTSSTTPGSAPAPAPSASPAQVIPWNFPLLMLAWKIAPALAAGNTVVLKPAETTPLSALIFAEILQQADLPPGVVNIITGAGDTGAALVRHPDVDKVAFTGSTAVGRAIAKSIAGTGKKLTLELGGKAANIVFDDAPIDQAIEGIVNGIFFNQGHVCCAGQPPARAGEHPRRGRRPPQGAAVDAAARATRSTRTPTSARSTRREQLDRIRSCRDIGEARGRGALDRDVRHPRQRVLVRADDLHRTSPTSHRIAREEIFGPVLSVLTFRTPAEAIAKANNTPYGLSAGIWTDKGSRILAVADKLRAGVVWANTFNRFDPSSPFGGYKESGYGREGGRHGLAAYLAAGRSRAPRRAARSSPVRPEAHRATALGRPRSAAVETAPQLPQSKPRQEGSQQVSRLAVPKTYKLYIGGKFPRSESGRTYEVATAKRRLPRQRRAGIPQGRPGRRASPPAARSSGWAGATGVQPRPGAVPHRRAARGPSCAVRRRDPRRPRASAAAAAARQVDEAIDRWVWYAGWADKYVAGGRQRQPGRRAVLQHLDSRADRGRRASSRRRTSSLLGLGQRGRARSGQRQHRRRRRQRAAAAERDQPGGGARDQRRARRGGQHAHRLRRPRSRRGWPAMPDVNALDLAGAGDLDWVDLQIAAADTLKRVLAPEPGVPRPVGRPDHRLHRDEDRLASEGPPLKEEFPRFDARCFLHSRTSAALFLRPRTRAQPAGKKVCSR